MASIGYQIGRRTGVFRRLDDLERFELCEVVDTLIERHGITPENVDHFLIEMMTGFV